MNGLATMVFAARRLDFDLCGMLGNFLYPGHHPLPAAHTRIKKWYRRITTIQYDEFASEKLHS